MSAENDERLKRNKLETLAKIALILDEYQQRGFWGTVPFALEFKAGRVVIVHKHGDEETIRIGD